MAEIDRGFGNRDRFYDLRLCATFPGLARMILEGKPLRFRIQTIESNVNAMSEADLHNHVLWPYLDEVRHGSEKMDFIEQKIQDMLKDGERHQDVVGDRGVLRKMIIFAVSPVTALPVALILRKVRPNVRQTLVLASDPPVKRASLYARFCRMTDNEV
ncbi:hypothetical protein F4805DRAFT_452155 [Annulohypoxylon moriforme]|nr:hypothetical protein F4805DRAFT_452155 [Annulohypoxylon moriforme]